MALSKVDLENQVENILPETLGGTGASQFPAQFRNIIINGDMSLAQRGTSESGITDGGYKTIDRWLLSLSSLGTWTQSQSTDVPSGQGFAKSLKMDCTTADASPSAGDLILLQSRFEGQNLQYLKKGTSSATSLTLSFWVKSSKTGTYICEIDDADNSRNINKSYTIDTADTWEKKTITYEGDTTGAFTNDNNLSMNVIWWLGAGSDFTSGTLATSWESTVNANRAVGNVNLADSTANEWYITGVQLEAGTTASDFEFLPHDVNLQRCQRYYHKESNGSNFIGYMQLSSSSNNYRQKTVYFPVKMRSVPSLTFSVSTGTGGNDAGTEYACNVYTNNGDTSTTTHLQSLTASAEL